MISDVLKLCVVVILFVDGLQADTNFLTGANDIIVVKDQVTFSDIAFRPFFKVCLSYIYVEIIDNEKWIYHYWILNQIIVYFD